MSRYTYQKTSGSSQVALVPKCSLLPPEQQGLYLYFRSLSVFRQTMVCAVSTQMAIAIHVKTAKTLFGQAAAWGNHDDWGVMM